MSNWEDTVMSEKQIVQVVKDAQLPFGIIVPIGSYPALEDIAQAQAKISFKMGYNQALKDIKEVERLIKQARNEGYKAGYEQRKSEEATVSLAEMCLEHRKAGQEEEKKKWIKEAKRIGILIAKPKEQAGIAKEYRLQGIREVVEWGKGWCAHKNSCSRKRECPICWQAKLEEWGIK